MRCQPHRRVNPHKVQSLRQRPAHAPPHAVYLVRIDGLAHTELSSIFYAHACNRPRRRPTRRRSGRTTTRRMPMRATPRHLPDAAPPSDHQPATHRQRTAEQSTPVMPPATTRPWSLPHTAHPPTSTRGCPYASPRRPPPHGPPHIGEHRHGVSFYVHTSSVAAAPRAAAAPVRPVGPPYNLARWRKRRPTRP